MIAYLKSENYRFLRKSSIYTISGLCLILITAAAFVLKYFDMTDSTFPYGNAHFFYSNIFGLSSLILFISVLVNLILTGKDRLVLKQSIAFGLSRQKVFWAKLFVTLSYFILLCLVGIALTILLGSSIFPYESGVLTAYFAALINIAPIILSGFILAHVLMLTYSNEVIVFGILLLVYSFPESILQGLSNYSEIIRVFSKYVPSTLLTDNLYRFMDLRIEFDFSAWIVGGIISSISLIIGVMKFNKKSID
ncbi:hypothetical protein LQF61_01200 [Tetragenococcus koreensis]|uniref:ABC transporter permease n=1 Tax=Tetragenococcus koreensis TaxID=290335 RepID=UPI000F4F2567|nr:ABC transporter permease [Tetragenococcus koreensis]AYW45493.1 ABC transporter permease [Tetragenococcus koreensis]MCF1585704.1 hypothetical protein [Tetragenococcus koreensis]MCF1615337.1 hypothetical protein [Tetragenococcus koreensis]MCF1618697.1 hypothetical protein [Tetragenococcus koreensis]MCF1625106.1 hypothetical protein [Tetragenococcus koreensis]